jgi:hypothetical protein
VDARLGGVERREYRVFYERDGREVEGHLVREPSDLPLVVGEKITLSGGVEVVITQFNEEPEPNVRPGVLRARLPKTG